VKTSNLAWNSTLVIKTKLKGLNYLKEIKNLTVENSNSEESGISQEIHMIETS
jgi:hypothetical protein